MKIRTFIICLSVTLFAGSCDYLDYDESYLNSKEFVFSQFAQTKAVLTSIYSRIPVMYGASEIGGLRSAACDEAVFTNRLSLIHGFNNGSWSATKALDNYWGYFGAIRLVNLFLEETKGQTFDDYKNNLEYAEIMTQFRYYPYEARFLRAYFYFELAKRYGDVPLINGVLTEEEANKLTRSPFDQVIQYIVYECDAAARELPVSYSNIPNAEIGRATKGMAMALKSKALLYAASPLFNPTNDKSKWEKAAQAAADIISIAGLAPEFGGLGYSLSALNNLWNRNYTENKELILGILQPEDATFERQNYPIGITGGGTSGHCPTQNLVDAYEMRATGLPVTSGANYETVDPSYDPQNPYEGRDPRLAASIAFNNSIWPTQYGQPVEIWEGGRSGKPVSDATLTGYYLKKYVDGATELRPGYTNTSRRHVWMILRYSEILLNYAEAMVEAYGDYHYTTEDLPISAKEAVDMVRARSGVGMPPFPATLTVNEFKLKLRNERRVELAFEDQRFWDIRRWKIAPQTTDIYGVEIKRNGTVFNYNRVLVEKRIFTDNMYLYPIPQSELLVNRNLTQNTGWIK